MEPRLNGWCHL